MHASACELFVVVFSLLNDPVIEVLSSCVCLRFLSVAFLAPRCSCADCREIVTKDIGWKLLCECRTRPKMRLSSFAFYHLMLLYVLFFDCHLF
uniref:Secreted protein n=1 Tax=Haemonchus contortus TaxID=6289 RepID=A0A7I4YZC5_HAECO